MQNSLINSCLDKIIIVENTTSSFQHKIVLPDNSIILAFQIGNKISEKVNGKQLQLSGSEVLGQLTKSKKYIYSPHSKTILVKFKPWSASIFFGNNLYDLLNQNVPLTHFLDKNIVEIIYNEVICSANTKQTVLNLLQQQFNYKTIEPSIIHAINIIYQKNGQIKVEDLAYKIFNSKRNFERKFKAVTGLTPKKFIMNVRFQFSLQFLGNNTRSVDIGYDCGYYDQSHFINEFKSIAGITPEKILTKLCRIFPISSNIIKTPLHHKLLLKN